MGYKDKFRSRNGLRSDGTRFINTDLAVDA